MSKIILFVDKIDMQIYCAKIVCFKEINIVVH